MPKVAFDPSIVLKSQVASAATRTASQKDAPAFASLLDNSQPPAADSRPAQDNRPANYDRPAARTDRPDRTPARDRAKSKDDSKAPSRADDNKDAKAPDSAAKSDDVPAKTEAKDPASKKADTDPASEAKKDEKTDTEGKAADVVVATATTPEVKPAEAAVPVAVAIPVLADPAAAQTATDQPAADATAENTIGADGKGKGAKPAAGKPNNGDATDEMKNGSAAGTEVAAKANGEEQPGKTPAVDTEKAEKADAHARGEAHKSEKQMAAVADLADKPAFDPVQATPKTDITAAQTAAMAVRTQQTAPTAATTSAAAASSVAPQAAAIPLSGVAFEITSKAQTSTNHFEIRLDPPELGKIEVRLDVDKDGNVSSQMIVDRPETLDLLRRDAAGLDRALQDAGLKTSNNGLQFQLRDQSGQQQQQGQNAGNTSRVVVQDENFTTAAIARDYGRLAGLTGGVDIHV